MKLITKFAKEAILNKNGLNHLEIELTPPAAQVSGERKPVCIVFAIDRSGSMNEYIGSGQSMPYNGHRVGYSDNRCGQIVERSTKMTYAQNAVIKFLTMLSPSDKVGVVSFDDMAIPEITPTHVTGENINGLMAKIRSISPSGCTNISDGINSSKAIFTKEILKSYTCKIILLSDGHANRGISNIDGLASVALDCAKTGITISSLGVGLDYNAGTMGEIARSGSGLFYHIEDLSKLEGIFKEELSLSAMTTAKNVKVMIEIPSLVEIGENISSYPQSVNGNFIEILMGDMYNARKVLLEIRNNFVDSDIVLNTKVQYKTLDGNEAEVKTTAILKVVKTDEELKAAAENEDIVSRVITMIKDRAIQLSSEMYEIGKSQGAFLTMSDTSNVLRGMSMSYSTSCATANSVAAELDSLGFAFGSNSVSASETKSFYEKSFKARRS